MDYKAIMEEKKEQYEKLSEQKKQVETEMIRLEGEYRILAQLAQAEQQQESDSAESEEE